MAKKSSAAAVLSPEADTDVLVFDAADELLNHPATSQMEDDVQAKVKEAHEELLALRLRQEEIERQKQHLEMIRQKQDRFGRGKRDMMERLNQAVVKIESELYSMQKLVQELSETLDTYTKHLDNLRALQPEKWQRAHVEDELDRAIALIGEAETDYNKWERRLQMARPAEPAREAEADAPAPAALSENEDMLHWAKRGFAFTLPLMGALVLLLVLARLMF